MHRRRNVSLKCVKLPIALAKYWKVSNVVTSSLNFMYIHISTKMLIFNYKLCCILDGCVFERSHAVHCEKKIVFPT
jgi:hypothetical protein